MFFISPLLTLRHCWACGDWLLWGLAQVTQKKTFWKRCGDICWDIFGGTTAQAHTHVNWALIFPLTINDFLFGILNECLVLISFGTRSWSECLFRFIAGLRDSVTVVGWLTGPVGRLRWALWRVAPYRPDAMSTQNESIDGPRQSRI